MSDTALLVAHDVTKHFGSGPTRVQAVDDVSLEIMPGEIVLIMGPSGSGKTTLLSMLGSLLRPSSGTIHLGDLEISALPESDLPKVRARRLGFIFQSFNLLDALTAEENILLPAQLAPGGVEEARGRIDGLLERLGLEARRSAHPRTLSGGEKQRVAIARALVNRAPLLLADEPTGNLDSEKGQEVTMILHDIARDEGCAVVIVTHDRRIEDVADRVLWLEDGSLGEWRTEHRAWTRDPVCGMLVDASSAEFTAEHAGRSFAFCSRGCLERFSRDPETYAGSDATTSAIGGAS